MVGWDGGGGGRVLGEGKGCTALLPWQNFLGSLFTVAVGPGCHHKPIKKTGQAGRGWSNLLEFFQKYILPSLSG